MLVICSRIADGQLWLREFLLPYPREYIYTTRGRSTRIGSKSPGRKLIVVILCYMPPKVALCNGTALAHHIQTDIQAHRLLN